jgi:uncharacterized heparinase superfamily protein
VRCGDVGQNGFGGHSHNDLLSYELSVDGTALVVDSGTYAYTFDVQARNDFRSTRAHNTVVIDGAEINPIDRSLVFELHAFARARAEACKLDGECLELVASHDGYRRLRPPVIHRRRFSLRRPNDELVVAEEFDGTGEHLIQSFIHFAPGTAVEQVDAATWTVRRGDVAARVSFGKIGAADPRTEIGWVSDRYGVREAAPVLVMASNLSCPASIQYTLTARELPASSA